jgi:hypothetical protein
MKIKEHGYVLAVDQASNCAGVSLWYNGELQATTTLLSKDKGDPFARRIQTQLDQLTAFLNTHLPRGVDIEKVVFEGVRSRLITAVVGAFMCCPRISAKLSEKANFIESSSWKRWAQTRGATGPFKDIKGVKALREAGWDFGKHPISSDDVADSILIYLTYKDRK